MLKRLLAPQKTFLSILAKTEILTMMGALSPLSKFHFSTRKISLEAIQQRAVVAHYTIFYIIQFQTENYLKQRQSIREKLANRAYFKSYILKKVNEIFPGQFFDVKQIGLEQDAFDTVLAAFEIENGFWYNSEIFNQSRMTLSGISNEKGIQNEKTIISCEAQSVKLNDNKKVDKINFISQNISMILNSNKQSQVPYEMNQFYLKQHLSGLTIINPKKQISFDKTKYDFKNVQVIKDKKDSEQNESQVINLEQKSDKMQKIILNPILVSGIIMSRLIFNQNRIISGDKGIGKSFTYLLYCHLSSFIIEVRLQKKHKNLIKQPVYYQLLRNGIFYKIKKMFYLPMKIIESEQRMINHLKIQVNQQNVGKLQVKFHYLSDSMYYSSFDKAIIDIQNSYPNIGTILVIDEANYYYSNARQYFIKISNGETQVAKGILKLILRQSAILRNISQTMQPFILNSSQDIQNKLLEVKLKQNKFFNYYDHNFEGEFDVKIPYGIFLDTKMGAIETYGVFIFEIMKQMVKRGLNKQFQKPLREYVEDTFKISKANNYQDMVRWKANIKPLVIRSEINKEHLICILDKLKKFLEMKQKKQVCKMLLDLQEKIQQSSNKSIQVELKTFYEKNVSKVDQDYRRSLILFVRECAFQQLNTNFQYFTVDLNQLYLLQIDIPKFQSQKVIHLQLIASLWNFARLNTKYNLLKIYCSPKEFIKRSDFIMQKLFQDITFVNLFIKIYQRRKSNLTGYQYGNRLDEFFSRLLKRGICKLSFLQYQKNSDSKNVSYTIKEGFVFESLNKSHDLNRSFKYLFQKVNNDRSNEFISCVADERNNEGFDFALLRLQKGSDAYQLITFDITAGKVNSKLNKIACESKVEAGGHQQWLMNAFHSSQLSQETIQLMMEKIQQMRNLTTVNNLFYTKLVIELTQNFSNIREMIENLMQQQGLIPITGLEIKEDQKNTKKQFSKLSKQQKQVLMYKTQDLRKILTSYLSKTYIFSLLQQFDIKQMPQFKSQPDEIRLLLVLNLLFYQQNSEAKIKLLVGQAMLIYHMDSSKFYSMQNFQNFMSSIYTYSKTTIQTQYKATIPQKFKEDKIFLKQLQKHHFFVPFQHLRKHNQSIGLNWRHIICVPKFRAQEYTKKGKKANKNYLFNDYKYQQNGRSESLSFTLSSFEFKNNDIEINVEKNEKDLENFYLVKQEHEFMKQITNIFLKNLQK